MLHRVLCWLLIACAVAIPASAAFASSGGESEATSLNPLSLESIQGDLALWTAVVFLLLLAVLTKFAWKPMAEGLDKREKHVADQIAEAEAANRKAQETLADYERKLAAARDEVRAIVEQGRRDAEKIAQEVVEQAKEDAKAESRRALKQIDDATAAAIKDLASHSAELAVDLAGKIVQAKLNPRDHARLIEQAVAGFVEDKKFAHRN